MLESLHPQLAAILTDVARLCAWLTILVVVFVPLERLFAAHPREILRKGIGTDLCYYFLSSLLPAMLLSVPIGMLAWAVRRFVPEGLLATTAAWPFWARALAGLVAGEIGYYWGHRWSHEDPFLWRFHSIHHSAEHVDFLVNTRVHPVDMVFSRFCGLVPIYVLGLGGPVGPANSVIPLLVTMIGTIWGFFIHANVKWRFGPLEWFISTPASTTGTTPPRPSTGTTPPRSPGSTGSSAPIISPGNGPQSTASRRSSPIPWLARWCIPC